MADTETDKALKMLFIREELSMHAQWLVDELTDALEQNEMIQSGDLVASLNYKSFKAGENPGIRIEFLSYGRAVDIEAYKEKKESSWSDAAVNRSIWGMSQNRRKKKTTYIKNENSWDVRRADTQATSSWGESGNRKKKYIKKDTRWYARNMYGGLSKLTSRIMYGLSEKELERLKRIAINEHLI